MNIELHLISAVIKLSHLFFIGSREMWFILLFNRNVIIFLVVISFYRAIKELYSGLVQFETILKPYLPENIFKLFKKFVFNVNKIYIVIKYGLWFWAIATIGSNLDIILSYFGIQYTHIFLTVEIIPNIILILVLYRYLYKGGIIEKWIKKIISNVMTAGKKFLNVRPKK